MPDWAFITNHAHVLLAIAENPNRTVSEIARSAQITERSAFRIIADLQRAGYIQRRKAGRRNRYELNHERTLEDPVIDGSSIRDLISLVRPRGEQMTDALLERLPRPRRELFRIKSPCQIPPEPPAARRRG